MKNDLKHPLEKPYPSPELKGAYQPPRITFEESLEAVAIVCSGVGYKVVGDGRCTAGNNS